MARFWDRAFDVNFPGPTTFNNEQGSEWSKGKEQERISQLWNAWVDGACQALSAAAGDKDTWC